MGCGGGGDDGAAVEEEGRNDGAGDTLRMGASAGRGAVGVHRRKKMRRSHRRTTEDPHTQKDSIGTRIPHRPRGVRLLRHRGATNLRTREVDPHRSEICRRPVLPHLSWEEAGRPYQALRWVPVGSPSTPHREEEDGCPCTPCAAVPEEEGALPAVPPTREVGEDEVAVDPRTAVPTLPCTVGEVAASKAAVVEDLPRTKAFHRTAAGEEGVPLLPGAAVLLRREGRHRRRCRRVDRRARPP